MTFGLATLRGTGAEAFAALVSDDFAIPLDTVPGLEGDDLLSVLGAWSHNLPFLQRAAQTIGPASLRLADFSATLPYRPGQVFCTGANYKKHVVGLIMGDPTMRAPGDEAASEEERRAKAEAMMDLRAKSALPYAFVKLPSCAIGANDDVVLPFNVEKPDWELELGVVIGQRARHVSEADAMSYVAGYAIVNDLTAREHVWRRDSSAIGTDWLSGKCFPTFLPFGPMIVPKECVPDPYALTIRLTVNGKVYQNESTADMLHGVAKQVAYLSSRVALEPGDVICTGSPYGNGSAFGISLQPGDLMEGSITGLGTQRNRCVAEEVA